MNLLRFIKSQKSIIHQDRMKPRSNSLMHQLCGNSTIHTARHSSNDFPLFSNKFSNSLNFSLHKVLHFPILATLTYFNSEIGYDLSTQRSMRDFGVELDSVPRLRGMCDGGQGRRWCVSNGDEALGWCEEFV